MYSAQKPYSAHQSCKKREKYHERILFTKKIAQKRVNLLIWEFAKKKDLSHHLWHEKGTKYKQKERARKIQMTRASFSPGAPTWYQNKLKSCPDPNRLAFFEKLEIPDIWVGA